MNTYRTALRACRGTGAHWRTRTDVPRGVCRTVPMVLALRPCLGNGRHFMLSRLPPMRRLDAARWIDVGQIDNRCIDSCRLRDVRRYWAARPKRDAGHASRIRRSVMREI